MPNCMAMRRSPLVEREAAQSLDETALNPAEPITVILSKMGWIRAAKGHDIDAENLSYKQGDAYLTAARGAPIKMWCYWIARGALTP